MARQRLTKAEEDIMQLIWRRGRCLVSDLLDDLEKREGKRPPHSTISSFVRILEKKGYVDHKTYGRTHEYFPLIQKSDYGKQTLRRVVDNYFSGSMSALVSNLVQEEEVDVTELRRMLDQLDDEAPKE